VVRQRCRQGYTDSASLPGMVRIIVVKRKVDLRFGKGVGSGLSRVGHGQAWSGLLVKRG
jgi:hypothetical protein